MKMELVKYNAVTDSVTVDTDGKITGPTADGLVTAKDVASTLSGMGWKANSWSSFSNRRNI